MSVIGWIKDLVKPVSDIIDEAVVDRDKKKQLKHDIEMALLAHAENLEKEITKRHELDMQSDSWLSKNIRPLSLIFLTFVFVIITFFDGNIGEFAVNPAYIPLYQSLLITVFSFYFGGRSIEKGVKIFKNNQNG